MKMIGNDLELLYTENDLLLLILIKDNNEIRYLLFPSEQKTVRQ